MDSLNNTIDNKLLQKWQQTITEMTTKMSKQKWQQKCQNHKYGR